MKYRNLIQLSGKIKNTVIKAATKYYFFLKTKRIIRLIIQNIIATELE